MNSLRNPLLLVTFHFDQNEEVNVPNVKKGLKSDKIVTSLLYNENEIDNNIFFRSFLSQFLELLPFFKKNILNNGHLIRDIFSFYTRFQKWATDIQNLKIL